MTAMAQPIAIALLVSIELVRFGSWALKRLGVWLDRVYERRQAAEAARAAAADVERARLVNVGNQVKWGLLRQAGLVDDKRDRFEDSGEAA